MKKKLIILLTALTILTSFSSISLAYLGGNVLPEPIRDSIEIVEEM